MTFPKATSTGDRHPLSLDEAQKTLVQYISNISFLEDATVSHVPDLDIAEFYAFSVLPKTGLAGEVIYLVGPEKILTSGNPEDFEYLMEKLNVGRNPNTLDVHTFAKLFLRFRVVRRGTILDTLDSEPLILPGRISAEQFTPPEVEYSDKGVTYRFWVFDTNLFEPVYWEVHVTPDGKTQFKSSH